jgi:hypothetical protein
VSATHTTEVAIIGAGPAGISLSRCLDRLGVDHVVLERGRAGETWRKLPPSLRLLSPWWTNALSLRGALGRFPTAKATARDFTAHLLRLADRQQSRIRCGADVLAVARTAAGYSLALADGGQVHCRALACCTGYFSNPAPPRPAIESDGSLREMHAADISDYAQLEALKAGESRALVVGKRVTAGQLALELHRRGFKVALSAMDPIAFRRDGWLGEAKDTLYFPYEALRLALQPRLSANSFPIMDGGAVRKLVESGAIGTRTRAVAISRGAVEFDTGAIENFELVIHATGYAPSLAYLRPLPGITWQGDTPATRDFEVLGHPGLFLLGLDNLYNFTSRYLRGIRRDAAVLAPRLRAHVRAAEPKRATAAR